MDISDELNPKYTFSTTVTMLLCKIARGELDAVEIAQQEMRRRGLGIDGKWIGFREADQIWNEYSRKNN